MGLFGFPAPKKKLSEAEQKWNLMWDLWAEGEAESPYAELMEYEGEVNNGGHSQYFFNEANCETLDEQVRVILPLLPEPLRGNLKRGYEAFSAQADICDDVNDALFEECDCVFSENEQLLIDILKVYADSLSL